MDYWHDIKYQFNKFVEPIMESEQITNDEDKKSFKSNILEYINENFDQKKDESFVELKRFVCWLVSMENNENLTKEEFSNKIKEDGNKGIYALKLSQNL